MKGKEEELPRTREPGALTAKVMDPQRGNCSSNVREKKKGFPMSTFLGIKNLLRRVERGAGEY